MTIDWLAAGARQGLASFGYSASHSFPFLPTDCLRLAIFLPLSSPVISHYHHHFYNQCEWVTNKSVTWRSWSQPEVQTLGSELCVWVEKEDEEVVSFWRGALVLMFLVVMVVVVVMTMTMRWQAAECADENLGGTLSSALAASAITLQLKSHLTLKL